MQAIDYIVSNALIIIPVLNILGRILKGIEKFPDKFIPVLLLPVGILGALLLCGFSADSLVQGILVTGTAVYGHQLFKQMS